MITYARYVHETRVDDYLRLGWLFRDLICDQTYYMVALLVWPCACPIVEPVK